MAVFGQLADEPGFRVERVKSMPYGGMMSSKEFDVELDAPSGFSCRYAPVPGQYFCIPGRFGLGIRVQEIGPDYHPKPVSVPLTDVSQHAACAFDAAANTTLHDTPI